MSNKTNKKANNKTIVSGTTPINKLLTKTDYIAMCILSIIFAIMVFYNLGSTKAPETSLHLDFNGNHEVTLDMGDYVNISTIQVFLGSQHDRTISKFVFNENTGKWMDIGADTISTVFNWNTVDIYYYARYFSMVFGNESADINEIICFDGDGNIVTPVNASDYPTLFDEQDTYPAYNSYYYGTMFDEIYHGRTAYEFIHGLTTYETTHPHLGKILISLGVRAFGMNPFGWRFSSALIGLLMVPALYIFIKKLSENTFVACAGTSLLVFDLMHLGLSRISTIDIHIAFFIVLMYMFMFGYIKHEKTNHAYAMKMLGLCGISMALGVATKFTGVYAGLGLGVIFMTYTICNFPKDNWKKLLGFCLIFFVAIPIVVYTLAFIPAVEMYPSSNLITKAINGTRYMFDYHSKLVADHPYSSEWYTWIIDAKPLLTAYNDVENGKVSAMVIMGNPIVFWGIIPCLIFMIYRTIFKKDRTALFLLAAYAFQYLPWAFIGRIVFIYHYLPASIMGMLIISYTFKLLMDKTKNAKIYISIYLSAVIIIFIMFYPAATGLPANIEHFQKLEWLPHWLWRV